jgi:hypothetical protein
MHVGEVVSDPDIKADFPECSKIISFAKTIHEIDIRMLPSHFVVVTGTTVRV